MSRPPFDMFRSTVGVVRLISVAALSAVAIVLLAVGKFAGAVGVLIALVVYVGYLYLRHRFITGRGDDG